MGLDKREGGKYITIYNGKVGDPNSGKFAVRVEEGTPGAKTRVNKEGRTVHELFYDSFTGKLVNIRTRESGKYGKSWEFDFKDNGEVYTLQLSFSNSYATNLLKILPNADLMQEMKVQPSVKVVDNKMKSSLFVSQNGVTLKHAYTKDVPNGLPPMVQVQVKGQLVWDDSARLVFLEEMVRSKILPQLPRTEAVAAPAVGSDAAADAEFAALGETGGDDDF